MASMIGEELSNKFNPTEVIEASGGILFANEDDQHYGRRLDLGRTVHYWLYKRFQGVPNVEIETFHDHARRRIVACVKVPIKPGLQPSRVRYVMFDEREASAPDHWNSVIQHRLIDLYHMYMEVVQVV